MRFLKYFASALARVVDWTPAPYVLPKDGFRIDRQNLNSDMAQIGKDMEVILGKKVPIRKLAKK